MIRRAFSVAAALSLALFVLFVVAYVLSHARPSQVIFVRAGYFWDLHLTEGGAGIGRFAGWTRDEPAIASTLSKHPIEAIRTDYIQHTCPLGSITTGFATVFDSTNKKLDPWGNAARNVWRPFVLVGIHLENAALSALILPTVWLAVWYWQPRKRKVPGFPVGPIQKQK